MASMWDDTETDTILKTIPDEPYSRPGSGYFKIPVPNGYVCQKNGYLRIYFHEGGMLQVPLEHVEGDIAPFSD